MRRTIMGCLLLWRLGWRLGWRLNILSLGDEVAGLLGVHPEPLRRWGIALTTALTALAVSVSWIIAWVGLLVPHAAWPTASGRDRPAIDVREVPLNSDEAVWHVSSTCRFIVVEGGLWLPLEQPEAR